MSGFLFEGAEMTDITVKGSAMILHEDHLPLGSTPRTCGITGFRINAVSLPLHGNESVEGRLIPRESKHHENEVKTCHYQE